MERKLGTFKRMAAPLRRFRRAEEGSYLAYIALSAIPMVAAAGLGVDVAMGYMAESRLQSAIDAAAIAMASAEGTDAEIIGLGERYFYANFPNSSIWVEPTNLTIDVTRLVPGDPTSRPESFEISASARVNTLFFQLVPYVSDPHTADASRYDHFDVNAVSGSVTEVQGLEVVLVLDVTGSMYSNYSGGERRIEAMRDAALKMVDILFGGNAEPDLLKVSIVPYNTAVNIGTDMCAFVTGTGLNPSFDCVPTTPNPFGATTWFGCVQTRKDDNDLTDVYNPGAIDGTGEWPAYRWPIEPDRRSSGSTYNYCETRASNSTGDYYRYEDPLTDFEASDPDNWIDAAGFPVVGDREYDRDTDGPNKGCPSPLLPLTNNRADVWNYLQDTMTVVDINGTITATGLTWGWHVISPGHPFDQGEDYDNSDWEKAIILLTDGQQVMTSQNSNCDNAPNVTNPTALQPPTYGPWQFDPATYNMDGIMIDEGPDYRWSAYGYVHPLDSRPIGTGLIQDVLEDRLEDVCDAIKAVPDPVNGGGAIQIFTITFGNHITVGDDLSELMRRCTTDPLTNYHHAPNTAALEAAFEEIARQLTSLRLAN